MTSTLKILLVLATILSLSAGHSKQFQLLRNLLTSSLDSIRRNQQVLKRDIMSDVQIRLVPHIRRELKEEIFEDLRKEFHVSKSRPNSAEFTNEVKSEIEKDVHDMVNGRLREDLRDDIVGQMRQEIQEEIRKGLASFLRSSLKNELTKELRREMKQEVQSSMIGYLAESLREDVIKEVERGGPIKVQTKLTPYQRRVLKQDMMKDLKGEIQAGFQDRHLHEKIKRDIMHNIKHELNGAHTKESSVFREEIMKDVKTEVARTQDSKHFQRVFKEDIMDAVRREIESVHQSDREKPGSYQRMSEYMERMNDIVEENSNKLHGVPSQDTVQSLTKKVRHLQRKFKALERNIKNKLPEKKQESKEEESKEEENVMIIPREDMNIIQGQDKRDVSSTRAPLAPDSGETMKEMITRRQVQSLRERQIEALMNRNKHKGHPERKGIRDSFRRNTKENPKDSVSNTVQERYDPDRLNAPSTIIKLDENTEKQESKKTGNLVISTMARVKERYPNVDRLLVAKQNHSDAYFVDVKTGGLHNLSSSLGKYVGDIAFDEIGRRIYWSDWRIDAIFSYSLLDDEQVLIKPNTLSYGLEVDAESRVVVCSDYWSRTIFTMDIDLARDSSRSIHQLVRIDEGNPMRIALDSPHKRIYVTVSYTKILQINYETGRIRTMVEMQRSFINSLALNARTKTLYFNNFTSVMAKRVNRRRKEAVTVFHISGKEPSDLLVYEGQVFVVYYNSADVDVVRSNKTDPDLFKEMPFVSGHLRTSMCFIPAH